jgi:TolB-like protein/DNA-binding winged helix-turn-helix (wHTH) protein/Tfp pilus assembly protein PilF
MTHRPQLIFGDFAFDVRAWRLTRGGRPLPVEPKGLALLALLLQRPGEVVAKGEILDEVWKETAVTENAMVRVIAHLRSVLEDDPKQPRYIETVHTRGYRFVAPVTLQSPVPEPEIAAPQPLGTPPEPEVHAFAGGAGRRVVATRGRLLAIALLGLGLVGVGWFVATGSRTPATAGPAASVAILPLDNLGPASDQYFADGMTEAITTQLARIEALKVIAPGAVARYRGTRPAPSVVARALDVTRLVEGSVLLVGGRVRITARLVDGATDRTLWGDTYEGDLQDVLALQGRVARAIAGEIRVRMTSDEERRLSISRSVAPAAYEEYLRGLFEYERAMAVDAGMFAALREAIVRFGNAVVLEPTWGEAHGALAQTHLRLAGMSDVHAERLEQYGLARDAAARALELDQAVVTARLVLARTSFFLDGDWEGADRHYREAFRLEPNNPDWGYGLFLIYAGRSDEGITRLRYALERWPTSPTVRYWLAACYVCEQRYDEAMIEARELLLRLGDRPHAALIEGMVLARTGRHVEAIELLEAHREALLVNRASTYLQVLSHAAARAGDQQRARAAIAELERLGGRRTVSTIFALGDTEGAIARVEELYALRDYTLLQARCWPEYHNLRKVPRIDRILREVGAPRAH